MVILLYSLFGFFLVTGLFLTYLGNDADAGTKMVAVSALFAIAAGLA